MSETITGGCLCGNVEYRCEAAPIASGQCQCADCRRSSGSAHCSHMMVPKAAFAVTGATKAYDRPADSGNVVSRVFCPECGAPVYSLNDGFPDAAFIRASSLDDPEVFKPQMIVFTSRGPSWDRLDPDLPAFPEMPPPDAMPG